MSETYHFRYKGAEFRVNVNIGDDPTTTLAPNLHVIAGPWQIWHLDPGKPGGARPSLFRSVDPTNPNAEHPAGGLNYEASDSNGGILCIDSDGTVTGSQGRLYERPIGSATVWRMHNQ